MATGERKMGSFLCSSVFIGQMLAACLNMGIAPASGGGGGNVGTPIICGNNTIYGGSQSNNVGQIVANQCILTVPTTITSVSAYLNAAAGNVEMGVYDNAGSGGHPGALIVGVPSTPISVTGWNTFSVTPTLVPAGTYYVAFTPGSNTTSIATDNIVTTGFYAPNTCCGSPMPTPFPAVSGGSWDYSVYLSGTQTPVAGPAIATNTFLNTLGANTHIDQGNAEGPYEPMFTYTGIRHGRDGLHTGGNTAYNTLHANTVTSTYPGVTYVVGASGSPTTLVSEGDLMANAGSLYAFEGPNEPNNFGYTYNSVQCGGAGGTWLGCAQNQRDLYADVKADNTAKNFPVYNASETGAEFDNVGLQCQKLDASCPGAAAVTLMAANTKYNDYMNAHNYIQGNIGGGGVINNMAWQAADPECAGCPWVSAWAGWGQTWMNNFQGYVHGTGAGGISNIPRVTTEDGWGSENSLPTGIGLEPEARLYMNIYLAQFKRGWAFTAIYQMVDSQGGGGQSGFFDSSGVPKSAAIYLHNLTTVLADTTSFTPTSLVYSIPAESTAPTVHDILLQNSSGLFFIVVWDERVIGNGADNITINFPASQSGSVYDTTFGTTPVSTFNGQTSVALTMTDHPMIVQVGTPSGGGGGGNSTPPGDILATAGSPMVVGYSMNRALKASYSGPLFQVMRASDNTTRDITIVNGLADHVTYENFCASTTCYLSKMYEQGPSGLHQTPNGSGTGFMAPTVEVTLTNGKKIFYAIKQGLAANNGNVVNPNIGYSAGTRAGGPNNGGMPGTPGSGASVPVTSMWVVLGGNGSVNGNGGCCFDFGEAESSYVDNGLGHQFANKIETGSGLGSNLQFATDLENGQATAGGSLTSIPYAFGIDKTDGVAFYTSKHSNAQSGTLIVDQNNVDLSVTGGQSYKPMHLEGGIAFMTGGDGSNNGAGAFLEGWIVASQTSNATDDSIQTSHVCFYGTGCAAPTPTAFYVAPTTASPAGNDANPGTLAAPFATPTKAQTAMRVGGAPKITIFRGGNYTPAQVANCNGNGVPCMLDLQAADAGTTWQYYPPDGVDSASFAGGSSGTGTGMYYMISVHAANVTINGLNLHNFQDQAIGSDSGASSNLTVINNIIANGFGVSTNPGAVRCYGCANLTVAHNWVHDMVSQGVDVAGANGTVSRLTVDGNFFQNTCTGVRDCAAIYQVDTPQTSTGTRITNNFIRDGNTNATFGTGFGSAIYMDDCTSNVLVSGNVVTGRNGSNTVHYHGGRNIIVNNNLLDLSTNGQSTAAFQFGGCPNNTMDGLQFEQNIVISGGGGGGYNLLSGPVATAPTITNNAYHNYAGAAVSTTGNWSDANPTQVDPQLNCWAYKITAGSPIYGAPENFGGLNGNWGPPGFVIPQTGSVPSSPHAC